MYIFKHNIDKVEYENFASNHSMANLLQSANWANIKSEWEAEYTAVYEEDTMVGCGLILIRSIKGIKFGYMPRGPILDYENEELLTFYIQTLKKFAKEKKLIFVKVDPKVVLKEAFVKDFDEAHETELGQKVISTFVKNGAKYHGRTLLMSETFQPRFDAVTPLREDVVETFSKETKRHIKTAIEKGVEVYYGGYDDIEEFVNLLQKTMDRQNINLRNKEYFENLWINYGEKCILIFSKLNISKTKSLIQEKLDEFFDERGRVKKVSKIEAIDKKINRLKEDFSILDRLDRDVFMSGLFAIGYSKNLELLYAGLDENYKSFYPQYQLYNRLMQKAFDDGYEVACHGGVEGSLKDNLTKAKSHYGIDIVSYIGEFDIVASPLYTFFDIAWKLRGVLKKLSK